MRRKLITGLVVAAVIAVPIVVKLARGETRREAELSKVEQREIHPTILATGNLVFRQEVQLSAEVIGKVAEIGVKEGDHVEQGQVVMRLDPTAFKAEVAQQEANRRNAAIAIERAQINLANQQRALDRAEKLYKDKFIDVSKYDDAKHQVELANVELRASRETLGQADALLAQARERLARTEIRSPIAGTVVAVPIKVGETAVASATSIAGSSLMTIADVGAVTAEVNVDEADVARVALGQSAKVFPAAFADKPLNGKVASVALAPKPALPGSGNQGRSYLVKLQLDPAGLALRSGMTCRVEIVAGGGQPHPAVPIQAVLSEDAPDSKDHAKTINYVYAVADGRARKQVVELGLSDDTWQEITKGLKAGETVATGPARTLHEMHEGERVAALPATVAGTAEKAQ
jgi:HlyD family secretion protein